MDSDGGRSSELLSRFIIQVHGDTAQQVATGFLPSLVKPSVYNQSCRHQNFTQLFFFHVLIF
jgi:hypothetical protein